MDLKFLIFCHNIHHYLFLRAEVERLSAATFASNSKVLPATD